MRRFLQSVPSQLLEPRPRLRYDCDKSGLRNLSQRFVQLACDEATLRFITDGTARHWAAELAAEVLAALRQLCLTAADANLLCELGQMFVLSTEQAQILIDRAGGCGRGRLLDCGAGDGNVTAQLAALGFSEVACTEVSNSAAARLREHGWICRAEELPSFAASDEPFDLVSCLNVL